MFVCNNENFHGTAEEFQIFNFRILNFGSRIGFKIWRLNCTIRIPEYFFEVQGTDDFQEFIHDQFDEFKEDWGAPIPVEDQEGDPAEAIVAGMEGGTQAVQRRKSAESGVLQTYNNETQQLFNLPSKM